MIDLGQKVLIAGFAREGQSALRFLEKSYPHLNITLADQNPQVFKVQKYPTFSGPNYLAHAGDFDTVIRSPGIPKTALSQAKQVTTAINLFLPIVRESLLVSPAPKAKAPPLTDSPHIKNRRP